MAVFQRCQGMVDGPPESTGNIVIVVFAIWVWSKLKDVGILHYFLGGGCCERQNVCIFDISFLQKIPNPVLSRTKHCCFCNKSNHCAFSTALPMSYIDTLFQPKQTWIIDKNNKTNKCKCLSKECSIALKMYRLYISTGVSLNICNSSFGHVHSKQVPIYAICSL